MTGPFQTRETRLAGSRRPASYPATRPPKILIERLLQLGAVVWPRSGKIVQLFEIGAEVAEPDRIVLPKLDPPEVSPYDGGVWGRPLEDPEVPLLILTRRLSRYNMDGCLHPRRRSVRL